MFLFLVRQLLRQWSHPLFSCELISNYVLIFGSTTSCMTGNWLNSLWIDFKLCSYFWFDNLILLMVLLLVVVNWFQIMFLFLVRQLLAVKIPSVCSCELISNYVLIFGSTTRNLLGGLHSWLWIDFKLCSYFWFDNHERTSDTTNNVVNWFQIMFLFLVRQL